MAEILKGGTPFPMDKGAKLILHLMPGQFFTSVTDLTAERLHDAAQNMTPLGSRHGSPRYNADGLGIGSLGGATGYVQFFRNGMIEDVMGDIVHQGQGDPQSKLLKALPIGKALMVGIPQFLRAFVALDVVPPVWCHISLIGANGCRILRGGVVGDHAIDRDTVELPPATAKTLDIAGHVILRPILDVIWNAAGFARCPYFNAMGLWEEPQGGYGSIYV